MKPPWSHPTELWSAVRFDPATATTVAAVAAVASAGVGAISAIQQGQAASKQAKYQSDMLNRAAERERQEAAAREEDYRRAASRQLATRRALLGASGVEATEGSPLMVSEDMAGEAELQALRIRSGGEAAASRLQEQAALARSAGKNARTGSFARAGASLLSGVGSAAKFYGGSSGTRLGYSDLYGDFE